MRKIVLAALLLVAPCLAFAQTKVIPLVGNTPWATGNPAPVTCISGCSGSGGTSATDEAAFTYGSSAYTPIGGVYNSSITNLTSGQGGAAALTAARSVHVLDDNSASLLSAAQAGVATNGATYPASSIGMGTKDSSGNIQPISSAVPVPIALSGLCSGCTASQGSATGMTGAISTTLAAVASVTEYVCGFSIRANATAAATGNATLSDGTITLNFTQWTAPNASGVGVSEQIFLPCRPASAVNTAWTLTSAPPGTGGVVSVAMWGYYK